MHPSQETRAVGRLVGDALAGGAGVVRGVHGAVSRRVFAAVGPSGRPVQVAHDAVAGGVYGLVRGAQAAVPRVAAGMAAGVVTQTAAAGSNSLADSAPGRVVLGAVNGLWGDTLARRYPELAVRMTLRSGGRAVPATPASLAASYPAATGRIAVFAHGLCESEDSWWRTERRPDGDRRTSFGARLADDLGYTPVYLRYNTGLHVSANGRELAALLEDLVAGWPAPVHRLALVGHSMGGLVARGACHYGRLGGHGWTGLVRHVFCLGSPHLGAPLEQGVNLMSWLLARVPETRPLAGVLNLRSVGVKDLRFGSCVEDDWRDADPDEFLRDRCTEVPFLPDAAYYFVGATVTRDPRHPIGRLVGDLMVRLPSASGRGRRRRIPFDVGHGAQLGGLHHLDLLSHPAVYHQLHAWMSSAGGP